jgi:transcriptional regulator with XRE-family HTH domain
MNLQHKGSERMGTMIRNWRLKNDWSQRRLGKEVNLSQSAIYMLEKGKYNQTRKIVALAKVMGIPPEELDTYDKDSRIKNKKDVDKFNLIKTVLDALVPDWKKVIPKSALQ